MDIRSLLDKIDANRDQINSVRPLTAAEVKELYHYYKIGTTYSSNALEGNSLTLTETKLLLEDGITVNGRPIKDCYEATGHAKAYDFMLEIARAPNVNIGEDTIRRLHYLFYHALDESTAGQYRSGQVIITGTDYLPPPAAEVPAQMAAFITEIEYKKETMHPVLLAAFAHRRLVDIHPFTDGNGRTARLLMNLILINKGYCVVTIPPVLRHDYIQALIAAQRTEYPTEIPFNTLIAECELEAQRDYCRMFGIAMKKETGLQR